MVTRVLVVDDSGFFRRRIVEIIEADARLKVVGTAANGKEAVQMVGELSPDVVTMDIEMPVMDGITALRQIMASKPTPVLMFSSLTHDGAQATLDALEAGAVDFLPKRFEDIAKDRDQAKMLLRRRIHAVSRQGRKALVSTAERPSARSVPAAAVVSRARPGQIQLVAIACSTGGPVALTQILTKLPASFPYPILIVQHMPATFTPAFAARLNQQCALNVKEAATGDPIKAGQVLLAPGGRQMTVLQRNGQAQIVISDGDASMHYKPCADLTFTSLASVYGGHTLAMVLTGMGADGREGVRALKKTGALVWTQDEDSCVIYGMPMVVAEAGLSDQVLPLRDIGSALVQVAGG